MILIQLPKLDTMSQEEFERLPLAGQVLLTLLYLGIVGFAVFLIIGTIL